MASRNIAVVWRAPPIQGRQAQLAEPHPAYRDTTAALYSKAIDILQCPRGIATMQQYLRFWFWRSGSSVSFEDPRFALCLRTFYDKVRSVSPLIVIDSTMDPRVLGSHPRGPWEGRLESFDPRMQALLVNKTCLDEIFAAKAACNQNRTRENWLAYWEREYKVVNMMTHELAHLFGTFIGHGQQTTPPRIRGANPRRGNTQRDAINEGEGGEFVERGLTGGLVEFDDDGYPWLYIGRDEACRIDSTSIAAIMQGNIPQESHRPMLTTSEDSTTAASQDEGERPRLDDLGGGTGTILGTRGRSELPQSPSLSFRYPGRNMSEDYLRELAASPATVASSA